MRLVDTSFWVALFFNDDANHNPARRLWSGPVGPLLATNHILGEVWTFTRRRKGHADAVRAVDAIARSPKLTIVHVEDAVEREAWQWLHRREEREYSFVDATSFAIMRRRRISEALAFDTDFSAAGFVEGRP